MGEKNCPYLEACHMFKHFKLHSTSEIFIKLYCKGDFEICARKKLKDSGKEVPDTLLPIGKHIPDYHE